MENMDLTEQWRSMQRMFLPTSAISASLTENGRTFWETQDKLLNNMQAVANAWFNRRHVGTNAAREAAERMCTTDTFVDFGQAYQNWARGVFERVMEDCQHQSRRYPMRSHRPTGAFGRRKGDRASTIRGNGRRSL
jgi:hypothetical protein